MTTANLTLEKLKEHDGKFNKIDERFEKIDERFNKIDEKFKQTDELLDNIAIKLVDHDSQLENINTKLKKLDLIDDLIAGQDKMIRILERIDHERVATNSRLDRHEERIVRLEQHPALV